MRCAREEEAPTVFGETSVTRAREELQERLLRFIAIFRGELTLNVMQDDDMAERPVEVQYPVQNGGHYPRATHIGLVGNRYPAAH